VALGSWVVVLPGTLEKLFEFDYDLHDECGVSREVRAVTLGTLAVIGYALGRPVRKRQLELRSPVRR
jgi:hypothetical protein